MDNENIVNKDQKEIEFNYIKGSNFRVVHADGAIGNGTPSGNLFLVFYSERFPLPDSQTFGISEDGRVIGEITEKRNVNSNGVMREVEIGVMLDINVAKGMVVSLSHLIRQLESDEIQIEEVQETKD